LFDRYGIVSAKRFRDHDRFTRRRTKGFEFIRYRDDPLTLRLTSSQNTCREIIEALHKRRVWALGSNRYLAPTEGFEGEP